MIDKSHPNYHKFVEDHDSTNYEILAKDLPKGEKIVCPHDQDMKVQHNEDGTVSVLKNCFVKNPFRNQ